jgi:tRNA(fMet)-specific endonuclease VapC
MKFLLDTDICIYLIKKNSPSVLERLQACCTGDVGISAITVAELRYGADKSQRPKQNHEALDLFFAPFDIAAFDDQAATEYGGVRAQLESTGQPIGPLDTLIAAHAKSLGVTLVTNNSDEFNRIRGLKVENWT